MVSIPGVTFIFASLDGRLDLSDNFDLPCSFSRFIQRYNVERAIPHRRAVFVTEPVSVYIPSHFWRIRIFRISSFMPRRYRLRFVYEKKNCSVSIDTLHSNKYGDSCFQLNTLQRVEPVLLFFIFNREIIPDPGRSAVSTSSRISYLWPLPFNSSTVSPVGHGFTHFQDLSKVLLPTLYESSGKIAHIFLFQEKYGQNMEMRS